MVVCKFFQQGNCRYGQNCTYEHHYASKYSYHSNPTPQSAPVTPAVTDEQLINQVHSDVQSALRGNQWILSSYAPFKEKPAFPGLTDLSPEEARLIIYEAKANNNLDQAIAYMNNLFKEARTRYEQLLLKNTNITRIFRTLYKGENVASPFESIPPENSGFSSSASSVFRSAVQTPFAQNNQQPSIFSQNNAAPSVFAQNNVNSMFAQSNTDPAKSIFAQANQNSFNSNQNFFAPQSQNQNLFGPQIDSAAKSIFAQATHNAFAASANPAPDPGNLFASASQSIFAQNQQNTAFPSQTSIFQKSDTQNAFGVQQNVFQQASVDMSYYSKVEDLSPEDLEAFNSNDFKMGFIPELPPPHSLCF